MQENNFLQRKASEIIAILHEIPAVKGCSIYGSLSANTYDPLSDIDIEIDVSGYDNGQFMLELPKLLKDKINVFYYDYAPSLIPDRYIVSVAIDEYNPFLIVDFCCAASPHCSTVTQQQAKERNDTAIHLLKLWTANLKHYVRGSNCHDDIVRMGQKLGIDDWDSLEDKTILGEALDWLESHLDHSLNTFAASCRTKFEELTT